MTWWPHEVPAQQWQRERAELRAAEEDLNHALQVLAARRRRLPVTPVVKPYTFHGPEGQVSLPDLFAGRSQLLMYHFYCPDADAGICLGCSAFVDNLGHTEHLEARNTRLVIVSGAPRPRLEEIQERMGWTLPWYSADDPSFQADHGVDEWAGLTCFARHPLSGEVFKTFFTQGADLERLRTDFQLLDLTLLGRQEIWEDSPVGRPQTPAFEWWRLRDEYPHS